jgi:hypothetical protein
MTKAHLLIFLSSMSHKRKAKELGLLKQENVKSPKPRPRSLVIDPMHQHIKPENDIVLGSNLL